MEIPGGGGEYYEAPWNGKSWGGGGGGLGGGVWIFSGTTHLSKLWILRLQ